MPAFCSNCGAPADEAATFCSRCGQAMNAPAASPLLTSPLPAATPAGLEPHIAAMLCYLPFFGWIADIIFLAAEPYRHQKPLRFHALQSLFLYAVVVLAYAVIGMLMLPWAGYGAYFFWRELLDLAVLVLFIVLMVKTYQRQTVRLPFVGDWAAKYA